MTMGTDEPGDLYTHIYILYIGVRKAFMYYVTLLCLKVFKQLYMLESLVWALYTCVVVFTFMFKYIST